MTPTETKGLDWEDRNHYTKDAFKNYCRGIVRARRESGTDIETSARNSTSQRQQERSSKPIDQLRYESWTKKSRDETTFPTLQNDATFERWLVKFKAKLETSDIINIGIIDFQSGKFVLSLVKAGIIGDWWFPMQSG
eukprot:jgi/Psemu1/58636/gm1.58636_g